MKLTQWTGWDVGVSCTLILGWTAKCDSTSEGGIAAQLLLDSVDEKPPTENPLTSAQHCRILCVLTHNHTVTCN